MKLNTQKMHTSFSNHEFVGFIDIARSSAIAYFYIWFSLLFVLEIPSWKNKNHETALHQNHSTGRLMSETSVNYIEMPFIPFFRCNDKWCFFVCGENVEISNYDIFILITHKKYTFFGIEFNRNTHEMHTWDRIDFSDTELR